MPKRLSWCKTCGSKRSSQSQIGVKCACTDSYREYPWPGKKLKHWQCNLGTVFVSFLTVLFDSCYKYLHVVMLCHCHHIYSSLALFLLYINIPFVGIYFFYFDRPPLFMGHWRWETYKNIPLPLQYNTYIYIYIYVNVIKTICLSWFLISFYLFCDFMNLFWSLNPPPPHRRSRKQQSA